MRLPLPCIVSVLLKVWALSLNLHRMGSVGNLDQGSIRTHTTWMLFGDLGSRLSDWPYGAY